MQQMTPSTDAPTAPDAEQRTFRLSLLLSGIRCTLQYLVLPWLLPLFGFTSNVGVALTFAIGAVAIGFNAFSIMRMAGSTHAWRHAIIAVNIIVICLLSVLLINDAIDLWA